MITGPLFWLKVGGIAIVSLLLITGGLVVRGWHKDSLALGAVRQEMADLKAAQAASQKASQGLQDELQTLRNTRKPSPVVRLCRNPNAVSKAGGGRDGAATGGGELPQAPGQDIGPGLYGLADDADELAARLRACQALLK